MIHFACPQCRKPLKVDNAWCGRRVRCPHCRAITEASKSIGSLVPLEPRTQDVNPLRAPEPEIVFAEAYDLEEPDDGASDSYSDDLVDGDYEAKRQRTTLLVLSVMAGVLIVGVPVLILIISSAKPSNQKPTELQVARERPSDERASEVGNKATPALPEETEEKKPELPDPIPIPPVLDPPAPQPKPMPVNPLPKPSGPEDGEITPVPGVLLKPIVIGWETRRIQGFIVLLSTQAVKEAKLVRGKPFKALNYEIDVLVKAIPSKMLPTFRKVHIWVEWDEEDELNPNVIGKCRSGHGPNIKILEALKANSVELLSLKKVAQRYQASTSPSSVLLHEFAHVGHHLLGGGMNNLGVQLAYEQAKARGLYKKVKNERGHEGPAYAISNKAEYFAELSCAYLHRCSYYPFTKEELEEYDSVGYQLVEGVWKEPDAKGKNTKGKPAGSPAKP